MPIKNDLSVPGFSPTANPARLLWLDVLRGLAVMLVLFRHMTPLPDATPNWLKMALSPFMAAGWMGVDLFFVLSGFLVGSLLLKPIAEIGDVSISRFLVRRGFKIYPAFYLLLAVTIVAVESMTNRIPWPPMLTEAFFIQNYLPGVWQHTWSLAVEEHFYLLLAALVGLLARAERDRTSNRFRSLPMIIITSRNTGAPSTAAPIRKALGSQRQNPGGKYEIVPMIAIRTIGVTLLALGCAGWVAIAVNASSHSDIRPARIWRAARFIGFYSYAIYLWHLPVKKLLPKFYERLPGDVPGEATQYLLYFGGSIALAILTSRLLEFPLLQWRDRLIPSKGPRTASNTLQRNRFVESGVQFSVSSEFGSTPHLWR